MKTPVIRFRIDFTESANLGPGKIELLEHIRDSGSLSQAARVLGLSYRRAWLLLDSVNKSFDKPVTLNSTGGFNGGGAKLTPFGDSLIDHYRRLETQIRQAGDDCLRDILPRVRGSAPAGSPSRRKLSRKL